MYQKIRASTIKIAHRTTTMASDIIELPTFISKALFIYLAIMHITLFAVSNPSCQDFVPTIRIPDEPGHDYWLYHCIVHIDLHPWAV